MKIRIIYLLLFSLFFLFACEGENPEPSFGQIDLVEGIKVIDFENNGNAGDLVLLFSIQNPGDADQVQIFLRKGPDLSSLDRQDVDNPSPDRLFTIELSGPNYDLRLPADFLDIDGNVIEKDTEYSLGFLISQGGEILLNEEFGNFSLVEEHVLNGEFVGTWDDNLYTAFGISTNLSLRLAGGRASGIFYYSNNFTSCCEGENDGTISFNLKEDGTIEDFIYRQELANFRGGACPGTYNGEGFIENYTTLVINFSGDDCEGPHTGGRIRLEKRL